MGEPLTHIETEDAGGDISMAPEMTQVAGVTKDSLLVPHFKDGAVVTEILPPPPGGLRAEVHGVAGELAGTSAEIKWRGD